MKTLFDIVWMCSLVLIVTSPFWGPRLIALFCERFFNPKF